MLDKRGVVAARPQGVNVEIAGTPVGQAACHATLLHGNTGLGVGHVAGGLTDQGLQGMGAPGPDESPPVPVGVHICDCFFLQFLQVVFYPFGRADQAGFLGIPGTVDQGAFGPVSLFGELAHGTGFLHQGNHAAHRVSRPVHPGIVVVAPHNPLVRKLRPLQRGDHIVRGLQAPFEFQLEVHSGRAGADVVGDGQGAPPGRRGNRPLQCPQQGLGIGIGNRQHRNLGNGRRSFPLEPLCIFSGRIARGKHVAGVKGHVHDRAPLYAGRVLEGPFRVHVALVVAVIFRVGINDAANGPFFGSQLGLDAPP